MGIAAGSFVGAEPDTIARYIKETREAIAGTALAGAPIGHVDTWTAWYNGSNQAVIDAADWLGMDAYPYFQDTMPNDIGRSGALFSEALGKTSEAGGGKPVWITETGHPVSGKTVGQSVASADNARAYWHDVGCPLFATANVWWYTLQDASPDTPNPSFGVVGSELTTKPLFDLSCDDVSSSVSSAVASASATASASASKASGTATATGGAGASTGSADNNSGGSPTGLGSSQASLEESATVTPSSFYPGATGTGTGTGTGGTVPSPGTNGTYSTTTAPPASFVSSSPPSSSTETSAPPPVGGAGGLRSSALGAAFVAVIGAVLAL